MTTTTTQNLIAAGNKLVNEAIEEARQWLVAGCDTQDRYMRVDHEYALRTFEGAIFHDDLIVAANECIVIANSWASCNYDGFRKLWSLTHGWYTPKEVPTTDLDGEPATQQVRVVDLGRDGDGDWLVTLQWDCGNQTRVLVSAAIEMGLLQSA